MDPVDYGIFKERLKKAELPMKITKINKKHSYSFYSTIEVTKSE